ncbi:phenolic glucoside malonyltransferase 1-like [Malus sylvestris]|uniref:phenolic glucoside malonyltransferase 1-like n=1 Tax=Malus domestica TaxID=3750 RepID=UPI0010A9B621|nr:phenolic glucoside malonyltransferase 1-like [Malus domestica]XP_050160753.1 phenolic glucoside malonyltransferase 1-like [Malus sylvestris]
MAYTNSVKVVEACRVAPHPTSPDSTALPTSLPLTFFDIRWLRFQPVQRLYFYQISTSFDTKLLFSKLKTSLSITLQHFLPLAGNLTWPQESPKPTLNYVEGDAVSLTVAETDADFYRLSSDNDFLEAQEYHPLVPQLPVSHEKAAIMALQVTIFPNKGFSIGTTMHHAVLDGKSSTTFVKSWAHICKHIGEGEGQVHLSSSVSLPDELRQFYDRRVVTDPAELGTLFVNQYLNLGGPNNRSLKIWETKVPPGSIRGTFKFTRKDIESLRQLMRTKAGEKKQEDVHVSTFTLACAYTWVCIVKAEEIKGETTRMVFMADCRPRLDPPLPTNYFGNCTAGCVPVVETKGLFGEDGLVVAVYAIREAIRKLEKGVLDGAENWVSRVVTVTSGRMISIAGSHRFRVYDTDFGWGRPKKVEIVSIDRNRAISFSDPKSDAGVVDVGLVLEKHHMEVFASLFYKDLKRNIC